VIIFHSVFSYLLLYDGISRKTGDKLKMSRKEYGHCLFKVLFQHLHAGTEGNKETTVRIADALAQT
jgi:hypothetical protein